MTDKTFGTAKPGVSYTEQRGAYLIAIDGGELHVIRRDRAYYLLGGAALDNRSHEETILQACMDATGFDATVDDYVADADLYDSDSLVHSVCTYYSGTLTEQIAPQKDTALVHETISLTDTDKLTRPIERWAVQQCIEMLRADAHGSDDEDL